MLCSHIMQYTCFPLFNYDKQTLWRAWKAAPKLHVMFNAWPGPTPWYENSLLSPTVVYSGPASILSQVSCTLRSAPAILVWRNDLGDLTWTIWEAKMLVFVFHVRHRWTGLCTGHKRTYAHILLTAEVPRLQPITQPESLAQDFCHMESHHSWSLYVQ